MFTEDDLKKLNEAIISGTLRVRYGDREVWYQTISEMIKARDLIVNSLKKPSRQLIKSSFSKGLEG